MRFKVFRVLEEKELFLVTGPAKNRIGRQPLFFFFCQCHLLNHALLLLLLSFWPVAKISCQIKIKTIKTRSVRRLETRILEGALRIWRVEAEPARRCLYQPFVSQWPSLGLLGRFPSAPSMSRTADPQQPLKMVVQHCQMYVQSKLPSSTFYLL